MVLSLVVAPIQEGVYRLVSPQSRMANTLSPLAKLVQSVGLNIGFQLLLRAAKAPTEVPSSFSFNIERTQRTPSLSVAIELYVRALNDVALRPKATFMEVVVPAHTLPQVRGGNITREIHFYPIQFGLTHLQERSAIDDNPLLIGTKPLKH